METKKNYEVVKPDFFIGDIVRDKESGLSGVIDNIEIIADNMFPTYWNSCYDTTFTNYTYGIAIISDPKYNYEHNIKKEDLELIEPSPLRTYLYKTPKKVDNFDSKWGFFINHIFIPLTGKTRTRDTTISEKTKRNFNKILKAGYTSNDFKIAIKNAMNCETLDIQYLTPEYITRPDKFEHWLNISSKTGNDKSETFNDFQNRMYGRK